MLEPSPIKTLKNIGPIFQSFNSQIPVTLTVKDETADGQQTNELTLDFLTERVTIRELIRSHVYQEVKDYKTSTPAYFNGLFILIDDSHAKPKTSTMKSS